jgi:hypothetical protein
VKSDETGVDRGGRVQGVAEEDGDWARMWLKVYIRYSIYRVGAKELILQT